MPPLTHLRDDTWPYGEAQAVAPGIQRVICTNASPFTHRGTNSWILGQGTVAIVDPGPADAAHLDALLKAVAGQTVSHIIVTHTHRDHSPGAAALRAATSAVTVGFGPHLTPKSDEAGEGGDHTFTPDITLADGAILATGDWSVTAVHTPGHCANHLCLALPDGILLSGDHVMAWSTTVVSPPDGDMADYMTSLEKLLARGDRLYLPGHGPLLPDPMAYVAGLLAHRREREAKVMTALAAAGISPIEALLPAVYGEIDQKLVRGAERSLLAHLRKLKAEKIVGELDEIGWFVR